ncbi:MAG: hypothetical protein HYU66_17010, partial [Armatimonadetes bacterium]|nr:hypothetical protein [Armatimonadota bacterium]
MPRYLRPADGLRARLAATRPALHFAGSTPADWAKWRRDFHRAVLRNLGPAPESVPLNAEVLST